MAFSFKQPDRKVQKVGVYSGPQSPRCGTRCARSAVMCSWTHSLKHSWTHPFQAVSFSRSTLLEQRWQRIYRHKNAIVLK